MSLVKEAEQKILNTVVTFDAANEFVRALENVGRRLCHDWVGQREFFEGISKLRHAINAEQNHQIKDLLGFAGIGGEAAQEYGREFMKKTFSKEEHMVIMHFLEDWGHLPRFIREDDERAFRDEVAVAIEGEEK